MTVTAAQIQNLIILEVGESDVGVNAVQTVTIIGVPTGGTFTLTYAGQTTAALAYNATPAAVQAALQLLSTIGAGNVIVTGTAGLTYQVTFTGALGFLVATPLTATCSFTGGTSPALAIAQTVAGIAGGGLLAANIGTIWDSYADKALIWPRLQELYTKRRAIDLALGSLRQQVDFQTGAGFQYKASQKVTNLEKLRDDTESEIQLVEKRSTTATAPALGQITTVEPISPPTVAPIPTSPPNANDPRYGGSPYFPPRWRR